MTTETVNLGFAGDWHGQLLWALQCLKAFKENNITKIYHVGDFGLWPGEEKYLIRINQTLQNNNQTLYVTLGNHENYDRVKRMTTNIDGWMLIKEYPNILYAPRGHVWTEQGINMGSLGGAGSIDRNLRTVNKSWWPEEEITEQDSTTMIENFKNSGLNNIDIMITHDAPAGLHRPTSFTSRPVWITPEVEHYCYTQRVILRNTVDSIKPSNLIHGHWHYYVNDMIEGADENLNEYKTNVYGLASDNMPKNIMILKTVPGEGVVGSVFP